MRSSASRIRIRQATAWVLFVFALVNLVVLNVAAGDWLGGAQSSAKPAPVSPGTTRARPERVGQVVLFFEQGQTGLGKKHLAKVARVVRGLGDISRHSAAVALHSHRAHRGGDALLVVRQRARSVLRCLVAVGFDGRNLRARDFGAGRPRVTGDTPEAAAQNRRVVINIYRGRI